MTIDALKTYYKELEELLSSGNTYSTSNSNRAHNATILRFMLNKSKQVNMFCGEMSIFRDNFYKHIARHHNKELANYLREEVVKSLKSFLDKQDTNLNLIVEQFKEDYLHDLIGSSVFMTGIRSGKIQLRKFDRRMVVTEGLSHFAFTDSGIVRMEIEKEPHTGICTVNMPTKMQELIKSNYSVLEKASTSVNSLVI